MPSMKICNFVVAAITLVIGFAIAYTSFGYGIGLTVFGPGAGFWPFYLGLGLIAVGVLILGDTLVHKQAYEDEKVVLTLPENFSVYRMMAAVVAYVVLIYLTGFYIATLLFLLAATRMLGEKRLGLSLAVAVVFCVFVYLVFTAFLHVSMPVSIFLD